MTISETRLAIFLSYPDNAGHRKAFFVKFFLSDSEILLDIYDGCRYITECGRNWNRRVRVRRKKFYSSVNSHHIIKSSYWTLSSEASTPHGRVRIALRSLSRFAVKKSAIIVESG
jgi:hypothetical protein